MLDRLSGMILGALVDHADISTEENVFDEGGGKQDQDNRHEPSAETHAPHHGAICHQILHVAEAPLFDQRMSIVCAESRVKLTENQLKMTTSINVASVACTMTMT